MRLAVILALTLVAMAACSGGSSNASPTPETHTITGISTIAGTTCENLPGSAFALIPGLAVTITDGQGTVLGSGKLATQGLTTANPPACTLRYSIPNVPVAANYTITTGTLPPVSFTYDELNSHNWTASTTIGD